jgi:hypothetical protein
LRSGTDGRWVLFFPLSYSWAHRCHPQDGGRDKNPWRFLNPDADSSKWDTPEMLVKAALFLAAQDAASLTGMEVTNEELCAWRGLCIGRGFPEFFLTARPPLYKMQQIEASPDDAE